MIYLIDIAEKCYEKNNTISNLLPKLTEMEIIYLEEKAKGKPNDFARCMRRDLKLFDKAKKDKIKAEEKVLNDIEKEKVKQVEREEGIAKAKAKEYANFISKCNTIEHACCPSHILRNGPLSLEEHRGLARIYGLGGIGEITKKWTGMVSQNALQNVDTSKPINKTRLTEGANAEEHFYNMQYSGKLLTVWMLYFPFDRELFLKICDALRQVHITTQDENQILKHNGQNFHPNLPWKQTYARNDVVLEDAGIEQVNITMIEDIIPEGVIEMVDEVFANEPDDAIIGDTNP